MARSPPKRSSGRLIARHIRQLPLPFTQMHTSSSSESSTRVKGKVELSPDVPAYVRAVLAGIPELTVTTGRALRLNLDGHERPLALLPKPTASPATEEPWQPPTLRPAPNTVGLVVAREITQQERAAIEAAGLSWCDGRGALHITWPGFYLHIERTGRSSTRPSRVDRQTLGVASIRGVQTILADPHQGWSVGRLAQAAAISSGQAHKILLVMDQERLLSTQGSGPQQRRYLIDRNEALTWLANIERNRRRPDTAATYLYARNFDDLIDRFAARAEKSGVTYALTGVSAAYALGHRLLTNLIVAQVRVSPVDAAQTVDLLGLERLEAEEAGRGMNLELITDAGELGTFDARPAPNRSRLVMVAPPVRVWLDMNRAGGREADAAALFKEQALERP